MNSLLVISLAGMLGVVIGMRQLYARRDGSLFTSIGVASSLYFVLFVVIPISLHVLDWDVFWETGWRWIFRLPFTDDAFVYASAIALIGYPLIIVGARCGNAFLATVGQVRRVPFKLVNERTADVDLMIAGTVLLVVGSAALAVYTWSIGGVVSLLGEAILFRGRTPPVVSTFAFLKNVAFFALGASYCFYAARRGMQRGMRRSFATTGFWLSLSVSLVVLYHGAGRLAIVAYVATFPLTAMLIKGKWRVKLMVVLGSLALGVVLFGKQLFFLRNSAEVLAARWELVGSDASRAFKDVLIEFTFPYVTLANATRDVPATSPYRYFEDLALAGVYLVPQRLLGITHPPMVSMVNTDLVSEGDSGTIPVDLVSFGYFSAGLLGVVIVTLVFGFTLSLCDILFEGMKGAVFRVALVLFVAFRVMYGDPALTVQTGFYLIVTAGLLVLTQWMRQALPVREARRPTATSDLPAWR